ncbi:MAG: hypothetical protein WA970_22265, partial [Gammaproteobacteria bacterium]
RQVDDLVQCGFPRMAYSPDKKVRVEVLKHPLIFKNVLLINRLNPRAEAFKGLIFLAFSEIRGYRRGIC